MEQKNYRVDRMTHKKAYFVLFFFALMAVVLVAALFKLQIIDYEEYQKTVVDQMTTEVEVNPE